MDAANLFKLSNGMTVVFWAVLVLAPNWKVTRWVVHTGLASLSLCALYVILLIFAPPAAEEGGFSSLQGVQILFQSPWVLLAGWVHYLAFDLFIGAWIARDASKHEIAHLLIVPILLATFWLGPVGLLAYFLFVRLRREGLRPLP